MRLPLTVLTISNLADCQRKKWKKGEPWLLPYVYYFKLIFSLLHL